MEITKTRLALAENKVYSGIFDCLRKIVKFEGFRSLYKGLGTSVTGIIPYASVDLSTFYFLKNSYVQKYEQPPSSLMFLLFGASAGVIA